jgi:hypothetical protein
MKYLISFLVGLLLGVLFTLQGISMHKTSKEMKNKTPEKQNIIINIYEKQLSDSVRFEVL